MKLKNRTPYIINALINWLDDSGASPQLLLKNSEKTKFPPMFASEQSILFTVSDAAIRNFVLDEHGISFSARFSGKEHVVFAPLDCIISLNSKDHTVHIPFNHGQEPHQNVEPVIQESKVQLSVIQGDNQGDGIPKGNLSLV